MEDTGKAVSKFLYVFDRKPKMTILLLIIVIAGCFLYWKFGRLDPIPAGNKIINSTGDSNKNSNN